MGEEKCAEVVGDAWKAATEGSEATVLDALRSVAGGLMYWSKNVLSDLEKRVKKVKKELEANRRRAIDRDQVAREEILRNKLEKLEEQVDVYWRQRAHVRWLEQGDRNTAFFHAMCRERTKNMIGKLRREDGSWAEEEVEKCSFISNFYGSLFRSNGGRASQQLLDAVERKVTNEMNDFLMRPFSAEEVPAALDSIGDLKAPGPDGMPALFYKQFWNWLVTEW